MTCAVLSKCDGCKDMTELSKSSNLVRMVGVGTTEISHTSHSFSSERFPRHYDVFVPKTLNRKLHDLWSSTKVHYFGLMVSLSRRSSSSIACRGPVRRYKTYLHRPGLTLHPPFRSGVQKEYVEYFMEFVASESSPQAVYAVVPRKDCTRS